jgi:hypothetical protein
MPRDKVMVTCDIYCRACRHWYKGSFVVGEVREYQGGGACPRCFSSATEVRIPYDHSKAA